MFWNKIKAKDNTELILKRTNLQATFEMNPERTVYRKQSDVLNFTKSKCLSTIEQTSIEIASKELELFHTQQKNSFQMPKNPKIGYGNNLSILLEAVKDNAKDLVLFYLLFLTLRFTDQSNAQSEIILGNLSETFLTAINAGRSEGTHIFNNAFTTYHKDQLESDSYLDTSIHFPHTDRTMISLIMIGDYHFTPLDEDIEYLSQTISVISFLPPPKKGDDADYNTYVQKSKNTNMENAIEERAEKCSANNK